VAIESVLAGVSAVIAALRVHHRACKLRKFQLHVRRFMGGFGRWTAPNNLNVAVGDSRLIGEANPRESLQEVPGSELHLKFQECASCDLGGYS